MKRSVGWILYLMFFVACAAGLREQRELVRVTTAAAGSCKVDDARCKSAAKCASAARDAHKAIQNAQEARSHGKATAEQDASARGSYAAAKRFCELGGWK